MLFLDSEVKQYSYCVSVVTFYGYSFLLEAHRVPLDLWTSSFYCSTAQSSWTKFTNLINWCLWGRDAVGGLYCWNTKGSFFFFSITDSPQKGEGFTHMKVCATNANLVPCPSFIHVSVDPFGYFLRWMTMTDGVNPCTSCLYLILLKDTSRFQFFLPKYFKPRAERTKRFLYKLSRRCFDAVTIHHARCSLPPTDGQVLVNWST